MVRSRFVAIAAALLTTAVARPTVAQARHAEDAGQQPCVDINTANAQQLQRIIHIGPVRAAQIIELRRHRPFKSVGELTRVRGIAARRLADIRAQGLACVLRRGASAHGDERRWATKDATPLRYQNLIETSSEALRARVAA